LTSNQDNLVQRYTARERANHGIVAITFILAALSGLALFYPAFFALSALFGGGPGTRILHPFIGVVMFAFFCVTMIRFWKYNRFTDADRKWMQRIGDVIANRDEGLPEIGKYNPGQKYLFWTLVVTMMLLIVSGIIMWRPYFADAFPIWLNRIAVVVHAVAAFVLIAGIMVHIYAAFWVKGSMRAMTRGTVTRAWAKHHHPAWYREITARK
jgi:formate dehydrogenase subunit gamma